MRLKGKRFRTGDIEVRYIASLLRHPRAGLIVPKYSHSAVDRNRVKRRLREIVRQHALPVLGAVDVVIRALPSAYRAEFSALQEQVMRACERLLAAPVS